MLVYNGALLVPCAHVLVKAVKPRLLPRLPTRLADGRPKPRRAMKKLL